MIGTLISKCLSGLKKAHGDPEKTRFNFKRSTFLIYRISFFFKSNFKCLKRQSKSHVNNTHTTISLGLNKIRSYLILSYVVLSYLMSWYQRFINLLWDLMFLFVSHTVDLCQPDKIYLHWSFHPCMWLVLLILMRSVAPSLWCSGEEWEVRSLQVNWLLVLGVLSCLQAHLPGAAAPHTKGCVKWNINWRI